MRHGGVSKFVTQRVRPRWSHDGRGGYYRIKWSQAASQIRTRRNQRLQYAFDCKYQSEQQHFLQLPPPHHMMLTHVFKSLLHAMQLRLLGEVEETYTVTTMCIKSQPHFVLEPKYVHII